jgi:transcriptional regulator with XRE-family HTH domain
MIPPTILGKAQADILAEVGVVLLQIKNDRRLTLEDMGTALGCSREMIAQYIAGEAEMGMTKWLRARETWPEMIEKWNDLRPKRAA